MRIVARELAQAYGKHFTKAFDLFWQTGKCCFSVMSSQDYESIMHIVTNMREHLKTESSCCPYKGLYSIMLNILAFQFLAKNILKEEVFML